MVSETNKPGQYAKGIAKRAQILKAVLDAYSSADGADPSFKEIAQSVGLSEKGMNHYFGSKNELLVAVLAERDRVDATRYDGPPSFEQRAGLIAAHNAETPRLLRLFLEMAAASSNPAHPAHDFFQERYNRLRVQLEEWITSTAGADTETAEWRARTLLAAADGLQIQWLLDPTFDLRAHILRLAHLIETSDRPSP